LITSNIEAVAQPLEKILSVTCHQTMGPKYVVMYTSSYFHDKDVFFAPALSIKEVDTNRLYYQRFTTIKENDLF
jgi:hypothetical protein